ncbi:MAG: T9SS type A sorting domain-containing protein [Bacteroidales bacterium]|nr:T9SS type A sorting domain-containing protein [Bacteroidales bacterium]
MKRFTLLIIFFCIFLYTNYAQNREDSIHIHHYDLHLNITDFSTYQIYGYTDLQAVAKVSSLSLITLDLQQLVVDSILVNGHAALNYEQDGFKLYIHLENTLNQYDTAFLRIHYHGVPASDSYFGGFCFSGEYAYNMGVAFNDLPHNFGRAWYPCMDVFTDKSTYTFHIETESNKKAICGGLLTDSTITDHNTIIWTWELHQPVPTYLTSVAVGEYSHHHDTVQGIERIIPIDIFTYPDHANNVAGSFVHLKDIFHLFEDKFGAYRWDRVGYVEVNFNYGAMEHVCNIAYPRFAITGNTYYESLYAHELSHAWFGNLITCQRAEEMWINEGFARYSESLIQEWSPETGVHDSIAYQNHIHNLHLGVLKNAHIDDLGYWALNQVPQNVTYGTTSYDKGGLTVNALRKYMGDSLYFAAIKDMLSTYAFQNISSQQLFDHLSNFSGRNMQDFYENYVNQPGFLHFSVDSIHLLSGNHYQFYVRQRTFHAYHLGNNVKIDITFFSSEREQYTLKDYTFSGSNSAGEVILPFHPIFAVVDYHEKLPDAIADYDFILTEPGNYGSSGDLRFILNLTDVTDSTFFRIENNFAHTDTLKTPNSDIFGIVNTHYWRIETTSDENLEGKLRFYYIANDSEAIDYELLHQYTRNDLVLLYRRNPADDWRIIPSSISGNISQGCLISDHIISGEYAIGVGNRAAAVTDYQNHIHIPLYPNPAKDFIYLDFKDLQNHSTCSIEIIDLTGKLLQTQKIGHIEEKVSLQALASGIYFIRIIQDGKIIDNKKVVKE